MGETFNRVLFSSINFTIFFVFLFLLLKKPLLSFLKKRKDDYIVDSEKCMKMKSDAEAEFSQIQARLSKIDADGKAYIDNVIKEAESSEVELLSNTKAITEMIKKDSERLASAEFLKGEQDLKKDFVLSVIKNVEKDLSVSAGPSNMSKYVSECSSKIKNGEVIA